MFSDALRQLPIFDVIHELQTVLLSRDEAVLEAPPGAGKTTVVPLALLEQPWVDGKKIILLEPRRVAARAAAERMADLLQEKVGQTVGYRMRMDTNVGAGTCIEVVTEGVFTRMLQDDPALESVAAVIFDEFHERSLDADLGLALSLNGRELFSDLRDHPLKLLVMSATLDGGRISALLNDAPVVRSDGKMYPVDVRHGAVYQYGERIEERVVQTVLQALVDEPGSILAFLPGQAEIRRVAAALGEQLKGEKNIVVAPLYGDLSLQSQREAIRPAPEGRRKIVLATNIAETSLTIDGVRVVVDSGLCREPEFDPRTGMTRLATKRISQSSATQRCGRAGRLESGVCYRLWSASQHNELARFSTPEILQADLLPLALQLAQWGVSDLSELKWLDKPQESAWGHALELLGLLGAVEQGDSGAAITDHGSSMIRLPLHPRLSHMLLQARQWQCADVAVELAVILQERNSVLGRASDIQQRLNTLRNGRFNNKQVGVRLDKLKQQLTRMLGRIDQCGSKEQQVGTGEDAPGILLACAYPDRIAFSQGKGKERYLLSNGRAAKLSGEGDFRGAAGQWLAVAELGGAAGQSEDRIYLAADLNVPLLQLCIPDLFSRETYMEWDDQKGRFVAEERLMLGALLVSAKPLEQADPESRRKALIQVVRRLGLNVLNWEDESRQWCDRINLLRKLERESGEEPQWPDVSHQGLLDSLELWLAPFLDSVTRMEDFKRLDLKSMLATLLPWPLPARLDEWAPERITVPSGNRIALDYSQDPPVLAVKLQEMFGCVETPTVAQGRQRLMIHLLSPAARPLQVTQDLAGFWCGAYDAVKKEMKGRYPKHPWPDDPMRALPTAKTKRHLS